MAKHFNGKLQEEKEIISTLDETARIIKAINHEFRLKILNFIRYSVDGESAVTPIWEKLKEPQAIISQHLSILKNAGIVASRKDGKMVVYKVNESNLKRIIELSKQINFPFS